MSGTKLGLFFVVAKFDREKIVRKQIERSPKENHDP